jgi:hypothetical protein
MDELLRWGELITYMTASIAAFIYIADTSFVYYSGLKKHLRKRQKENKEIKENHIMDSLSGSPISTPSGSIILNDTPDLSSITLNSNPTSDVLVSSATHTVKDKPLQKNVLYERTYNPIYDPNDSKNEFISLHLSDSNITTPERSPSPSNEIIYNRLTQSKQFIRKDEIYPQHASIHD